MNSISDRKTKFIKILVHNWRLYILLIPALLWLMAFCYAPMYGVLIAFKDYKVNLGVWGSPGVGNKYLIMFFEANIFRDLIKNTIAISFYSLIWGFPIPIIFALLLNQIRNQGFKRFIQTVTYAPYFISTVVMVSMLSVFLAPNSGFVNGIITALGGQAKMFMGRAEWFRTVYIASGIWQGMGFNAIIYIAALSAISPELHEAAIVDGASKFKRIIHIDIPGIMPTIIIMLILSVGNLMSVGYEKVFLMQSGMNLKVSEIISTYVYKVGLMSAQYSYATAIGLFNSVVNFALLVTTNFIARKSTGMGLF